MPKSSNIKKPFFLLKPGETIPLAVKESLKKVNENFSKKKITHAQYCIDIANLFGVSLPIITSENNIYLAGFFEGEGSINVSAKRNPYCRFGLELDPEMSITQHSNGIENLLYAACFFKTGRIEYKIGSNSTLSFKITNTRSLREKVAPFLRDYVAIYCSYSKNQRSLLFDQFLEALEAKAHLNIESMVNKLLPLWDQLRIQRDTRKTVFSDLKSAQDYCINYANNKQLD
jgi:hypothetical protein